MKNMDKITPNYYIKYTMMIEKEKRFILSEKIKEIDNLDKFTEFGQKIISMQNNYAIVVSTLKNNGHKYLNADSLCLINALGGTLMNIIEKNLATEDNLADILAMLKVIVEYIEYEINKMNIIESSYYLDEKQTRSQILEDEVGNNYYVVNELCDQYKLIVEKQQELRNLYVEAINFIYGDNIDLNNAIQL